MLNSGTQTENQWESQPSSSCPASLLDCCTQTENQSQTPPNSSLPASFLNSSFQTANILEVQQSSSLKPAGPTKSHNNKYDVLIHKFFPYKKCIACHQQHYNQNFLTFLTSILPTGSLRVLWKHHLFSVLPPQKIHHLVSRSPPNYLRGTCQG